MSGMWVLPGGRPWWALAAGSLAAAGFIGMAEAGAVVLEATPTGQFSVSSLYGIGQLTQPLTSPAPTLNGWAQEGNPDLPGWLLAHLAFDVLFIIGYSLLAVIMLWAAAARSAAAVQAAAERAAAERVAGRRAVPEPARSWRLGYLLLGLVVAGNAAQVGLAQPLGGNPFKHAALVGPVVDLVQRSAFAGYDDDQSRAARLRMAEEAA